MNKALPLLLLPLLLLSCSRPATAPEAGQGNTSGPPPETEYYDPDFHDLPAKSSWVLDKLNWQELSVAEQTGEIPTLELDMAAGKARGNAGCNRYNGSVKTEGNKIIFGHLVTTKVTCQAQPLENRYLDILNFGMLTFEYTNTRLLIRRDVRSVLEFRRVN